MKEKVDVRESKVYSSKPPIHPSVRCGTISTVNAFTVEIVPQRTDGEPGEAAAGGEGLPHRICATDPTSFLSWDFWELACFFYIYLSIFFLVQIKQMQSCFQAMKG